MELFDILMAKMLSGGSGGSVSPSDIAAAVEAYMEEHPVEATTPRITMTASDTAPTLEPNKLYVFPEMVSLAPVLAAPTDSAVANEYHFLFESGSTPATLTIPAAIRQPDGFTVDANHVYEVSILENNMLATGWAVSGT